MTSNTAAARIRFMEFLEENGAREAFEENFEISHSENPVIMEQWFEDINPEDYVEVAFTWSDTDEGHGYWLTISQDWIEEVN